jgi:NAD(P)-dependent dehydrogenase (short-subunit alcohol dehydrogenase family)
MALDRKVCLLTGAGGRLGSEFCRRFAAKYAIAAVCRRRGVDGVPDQNQRMFDPLDPGTAVAENQSDIFVIRANLAAAQETTRIVELTMARFGRIDFLVNAAVYYHWSPMIDDDALAMSAEQQFLINAIVPLRLSLAVVRACWRDRQADNAAYNRCIVNVSSTSGLHVYPGTGQSIYSASKAALNYLTCHMADEFRRIGIRVNGVAPTSFPSIVKTETVAAAIDRMMESDITGRLLVLDREREYYSP